MPPSKILQADAWSQALLLPGETSFSSRFFFYILEIAAQIKKRLNASLVHLL